MRTDHLALRRYWYVARPWLKDGIAGIGLLLFIAALYATFAHLTGQSPWQ